MSCREKCRELGFEDAIEYGIVKEYAWTRGWGLWELFREFVQNALDEMHVVAFNSYYCILLVISEGT